MPMLSLIACTAANTAATPSAFLGVTPMPVLLPKVP